MSEFYKVKYEDERLDQVVYNHYGHLKFIFFVLEDNPELIKNIFLPVGYSVELKPYVLENEENTESESEKLWL